MFILSSRAGGLHSMGRPLSKECQEALMYPYSVNSTPSTVMSKSAPNPASIAPHA